MAFVGEVLLLVPERVSEPGHPTDERGYSNLIGDLCRHGERLLAKLTEKEGSGEVERSPGDASAIGDPNLLVVFEGQRGKEAVKSSSGAWFENSKRTTSGSARTAHC